MRKLSLILLMLLIVAGSAFVVFACGDGEETTTSATQTVTTSAPETTATTAPPETTATTVAKKFKVGITQIVTHRALDKNREGFIDGLTELGYVEDKDIQYLVNIPEGDMTLAASIAKKFVAEKVDGIFAISTPSAQASVEAVKGAAAKIPVLFSAVTDPVAAGLVDSMEKSGSNVAGTSDWADMKPQMQLIKEIIPDLKTLGVVFNAGETNSVVQIDAVKTVAAELGFKVVEATSATSADVLAAAQSLVGRCDAVYFPTDNVVASAVEVVVKVCEDNKIALFAADNSLIEGGVMAAIGIDYYKLGKLTAQIMDKALKGADLATFPVGTIPADEIWLNMGAAKRMGVTIPQAVVDKAAEIVE